MTAKQMKTEVLDNVHDDDEHAECEDARSSVGAPVASASCSDGGDSSRTKCLVCGDVATGRHYGSVACNGCKGFFRRTIRRAYTYTCRFNGNCQIDRHNRAVCRACRYARCIRFGMKIDAVQNERDLIGKRSRYASQSTNPQSPNRSPSNQTALGQHQNSMDSTEPTVSSLFEREATLPSTVTSDAFVVGPAASTSAGSQPQLTVKSRRISGSNTKSYEFRKHYTHSSHVVGGSTTDSMHAPAAGDTWQSPQMLLELLMNSEDKIRRLRDSVIQETGKLEYTTKTEPRLITSNGRLATIKDIFHSLHSQLLLVIEWAKNLKPFAELSTEDQTALLKNFASQHIVLSVAYRSINASDSLKLLNDSWIPRANATDGENDDFYRKDCERVMDTLVAPMRFLKMDDVEFVTLKACILFNPVARGLSNESVMKVLDTRRKIFGALEFYVSQRVPHEPHRIGDLTFFVLSPLQCLARSVSEDVLVTKLSGVARIDQLMEELILEDSDTKQFAGPSDRTVARSVSSNADFSRQFQDSNFCQSVTCNECVSENVRKVSSSYNYARVFVEPTKTLNNVYVYGFSELNTQGDSAVTTTDYFPLDGNGAPSGHVDESAAFRSRTESAPSGFQSNRNVLSMNSPSFSSAAPSGGISAPANPSPIHDFEMFSTLSSAISSPSNDVLLSSSCAVSEPSTSPSPNYQPYQVIPGGNSATTTVSTTNAPASESTHAQTNANMVDGTAPSCTVYMDRSASEDIGVMDVQHSQRPHEQVVRVTLPPQTMTQQARGTAQSPTQRLLIQSTIISNSMQRPLSSTDLDHQYFASPANTATSAYLSTSNGPMQSHHMTDSGASASITCAQPPRVLYVDVRTPNHTQTTQLESNHQQQPPVQVISLQSQSHQHHHHQPIHMATNVMSHVMNDPMGSVVMADEVSTHLPGMMSPAASMVTSGAREPTVWSM